MHPRGLRLSETTVTGHTGGGNMDKRYLQLYSIGAQLREDFDGGLQKVSAMGYTGVEFAGTWHEDYTASALKQKLADNNLEALSWHIRAEQVPAVVDYMAELGLPYLIDPIQPVCNREEALRFSEVLNQTGKLCAEKGIQFGYHNHRHEFLTGEDGYLLETMILNTDPGYVCFQLDAGWATCSGVDAPAFLQKYVDRFQLIHVRECGHVSGAVLPMEASVFPRDAAGKVVLSDEKRNELRSRPEWDVATGAGLVDWAAVKQAAVHAKAFIVERDGVYSGDMFDCIAADCAYLKQL